MITTTPDATPEATTLRLDSPAGSPADAPAEPLSRYARPGQFYLLATAVPWALWIPAAWASHQGTGWGWLVAVLGVLGLAAPLGVVAWMTRDDAELRRDILARLFDVRRVQARWWLLACGLMPAAILAATALSVLLGYSPEQFWLRGGTTFTAGLLPGWVVLVLAPVLEELAWHSYGTDSLRTRFSLFNASMVFAVIWALWHLPLAFIAGSSQAETAGSGWLHALNFPLSMIPFVLLMNWVYYRSGRNIAVTVLFHLSANLITQILATHPDTEVMATGLLLIVTAVVLWRDRALFFSGPARPRAELAAASVR